MITSRRVRDFAIYIVVAIALVIAFLWATDEFGSLSKATWKWIGLIVQTAILFGYAVQDHKERWSHHSFWIIMSILVAVHMSLFSVLLLNVEDWKPLWFVFLVPVENVAIDACLIMAGHRQRRSGSN